MDNIKDPLEIILAIVAIIGLIYKISQVERATYDAIDAVKDANYEAIHAVRDAANTRIHQLEARLNLLQQSDADRREYEKYIFNAFNEKIDHKFNRLHQDQKDIQRSVQESNSNIQRLQSSIELKHGTIEHLQSNQRDIQRYLQENFAFRVKNRNDDQHEEKRSQ